MIILVVMTVLLSNSGDAAFFVKPGHSIQAAINAAGPGQTVEVQNGTYDENVNVTKRLILKGIGNPLVDARGKGSAITISANGSTLLGFIATGSGKGSDNAGIRVLSGGNMIKNNTVIENNNYGFFLYRNSNNTIIENIARGNRNSGYSLIHSNNNQILGNVVSENKEGISIQTSRGNIIKGNNLTWNRIGINISNYNQSESITTVGKGVFIEYRSGDQMTSVASILKCHKV